MSVSQFIENIQKKSEHERHVILWVVVSILFGIIFFVWLTTFNLSFTLEGQVLEDDNQMSPYESLKNIFSDVTKDIGAGVDVLTESISKE